ncbi:Ankyrin repeat and MYND domain-containing protein 2 [Intoshia linei]|uniref:Ankyrin repeat and MYND domain-containing protein 2 n=1 Tax=Intoshia linei TaxID=1819745 RepID=A0A177AY06_9BILA|nr:Ankyrin repeat and MYND domain-containing protein 2 [Intoshia linei]
MSNQDYFDAISNGDCEKVEYFLNTPFFDINCVNNNNFTGLQLACYHGQNEIVNLFIDKNANVNFCIDKHQYSPLCLGALSRNFGIVDILLTNGANVQHTTSLKKNALDLMSLIGYFNMAHYILYHFPKSVLSWFGSLNNVKELDSIYEIFMITNISFINIIKKIEAMPDILEINENRINLQYELVKYFSTKNEKLSIKLHYISGIIYEISNIRKTISFKQIYKRFKNSTNSAYGCTIKNYIIEKLLRSFAFQHIDEFKLMMAIRNEVDNNQNIFVRYLYNVYPNRTPSCHVCDEDGIDLYKCSKCHKGQYCSKICQKIDWNLHKAKCCLLEKN